MALLPPGSPPVDMSPLTGANGLLASDPALAGLFAAARAGELGSNALHLDAMEPLRARQMMALIRANIKNIRQLLQLPCGAQMVIDDTIYACKGEARSFVSMNWHEPKKGGLHCLQEP